MVLEYFGQVALRQVQAHNTLRPHLVTPWQLGQAKQYSAPGVMHNCKEHLKQKQLLNLLSRHDATLSLRLFLTESCACRNQMVSSISYCPKCRKQLLSVLSQSHHCLVAQCLLASDFCRAGFAMTACPHDAS